MPQAALAVAVWVGSSAAFAVSALGAGTAVAATVGYAAIGATLAAEMYAVTAAQKLLAPKLGTGGDNGAGTEWKANPRAGIPYAVGRCKVGGNIVFVQSAGASNKYINFVTAYTGAGPIDSFEQFYADDVAVTFSADSGEGASGYYLNRMWMKRQLGAVGDPWMHWTATGTKDTPANHGGMPPEWTSAHLMTGYAASLWALEYDAGKYSSGRPAHAMVGKWVKVYDPRLDSTYPGGSGTHRAGEEDTYEWSANPYLHALTWIIGRFQNGKRILGLGLPVSRIDVAAFVEGANVADANEWTCHGLVYSTDDKAEVLKAFLQAGAGKLMLLNNKISCFVNTPRVSLATIRSKDVVGDVNVSATQSATDRINMIWPTYTDESQNWDRVTPDDAVAVPEYFDDDGGERQTEVDYLLVADVIQAAQLARYDIEDSREFTPVQLPCKPEWMGYKPGDCITADEPEWGLNGQKLLILSRKFNPLSLVTTLTCRSETDGKHAYALGQTATPPDAPALTGIDLFPPAPDTDDWTAVGTTLTDNGMQIPAILIDGARGSPSAVALLVRFRPDVSPDWSVEPATPLANDDPVHIEIRGLTRGTLYNISIAYRSDRGLDGDWTDLPNVTAGDFSLDEIVAAFDDGALTPGEKLYVVPQLNALIAARAGLRAQADALNLVYGYAPGRTEYEDAADALDAALADLDTPVDWDDSSDLTEVPDPAAFRAAFENAIAKEVGLQTSISYINSIKTSDSKNLWRGVDWAVSGGGVLITPAFGQSGRGARLPAATAGARLYGLKSGFDGRYVLSFLARSTGGAATLRGKMRDPSNAVLSDLPDTSWSVTTTPQVFSWNITSTDPDFDVAELSLFESTGDIASGRTIEITDWKLTPGDTVTAWSPSPDDPDLLRLATYTGALNATYGAQIGSTLLLAGGGTASTSDVVTASGTAAAIAGQSAWATYSTLSPTTIAGRTQFYGSDGRTYEYQVLPLNYSVDGVAGRYTQPLTAGIGTISVASFLIYVPANSGITTISVPSTSFSGLSDDTTYTIFYRPEFGDWFPIVSSNAAAYKTSRDGYIEIGTIATPSGGGTWTAPTSEYTSTGLYDAYRCISTEALLASGKPAGGAEIGDPLTMMDPAGELSLPGKINAVRISEAECVTLRTENGGQITVSMTAPIMTRDGQGYLPHAIRAEECAPGMAIPTLGDDGRVIWTLLESVTPAGRRKVAMISAENGVYAAADPGSSVMIFTHNIYNKA